VERGLGGGSFIFFLVRVVVSTVCGYSFFGVQDAKRDVINLAEFSSRLERGISTAAHNPHDTIFACTACTEYDLDHQTPRDPCLPRSTFL